MEATVACLAERGYAATSTSLISERAGVSRGAQLHHFPTRDDLMLAAIEHVFEARRGQFRDAMAQLPPAADPVPHAIRRMWSVVDSDATRAWLELTIAARSDPRLHAKVVETTERLRAAGAEELGRLATPAPLPEIAMTFASVVMDGLVVQQLAGLGDDRRDQVLSTLESLASVVSAGGSDP